MVRKLRYDYPGCLHHVMSRGNKKQNIFNCEKDRNIFLNILKDVTVHFGWKIYCYVLMSSHYHILVETPLGNLSDGMRQLNGVYTQKYNRLHNLCGHLFQGRFKSSIVEKENYLLEVCRYIVLNPVRAKIVKEPEQYIWSSYRATIGIVKSPEFLSLSWITEYINSNFEEGISEFKKFVKNGMDNKIKKNLMNKSIIGDKDFIEMLKNKIEENGLKIKSINCKDKKILRPDLKELFSRIDGKIDRNKKINRAFHEYGYSQSEIGRYLGLHPCSISRLICRKLKQK